MTSTLTPRTPITNRPSPVARLLLALARLDRRLASWRRRAALQLLQNEHAGLSLAPNAMIEPGVRWRLDTRAIVSIGAGSRLRADVELKADAGARLVVGHNVHIGPGTTLSALAAVTLGDDCLIAERVSIRDHDHAITDPTQPYHAQGYVVAPVVLGRNVWVGGGVTIVKGVTLGDNCVVGANAVVTHSFPANSLIAGVPARLVRTLSAALTA